MGLNELDSYLKNKEEQEENERFQRIAEMLRKQINKQIKTGAESFDSAPYFFFMERKSKQKET